jgi:hypothetical protein
MPPTQLYNQLPWSGGLNTTEGEGSINPAQKTLADNVVKAAKSSEVRRDGINSNWDSASTGTDSIIGGLDYWFGSSTRAQKLVAVSSARAVYSYNSSGTRSALTVGGTAWTGTLTSASLVPFNNKCVIAVSGTSNVVKYWDGSSSIDDLPGSPPASDFAFAHQGRLWLKPKTSPDRLYYSPVADHTLWGGTGDSGAIDVGVGDGDPDGITAAWSFRGDLFVAKRTKLYRGVGDSPDDMAFQLVSSAIGCVGFGAVAVLEDDVYFVSEKGIVSLSTTASYGDFQTNFASYDIQQTFNTDFVKGRLKYCQASYLSEINSIAFSFTEQSALNRSNTTAGVNNALYLYNVPMKAWYRWPDVACQAIIPVTDSDKKRWYFGTHVSRMSKSFNGTAYDINTSGTHIAIREKLDSPMLFLSGNPFETLTFKRFILYFKPVGKFNVQVNFRVDDQPLDPENSLSYQSSVAGTALGSGFVLGSALLGGGTSGIFGPKIRTVTGMGRGCRISIEQADLSDSVEIQGFGIEYESAGTNAESSPIT